MKILLISDIHGNYPALRSVWEHFQKTSFDAIFNCGDSLVYAPFTNDTIDWLRAHKTISIIGNTDRKVRRLLKGKDFKKPSNKEKRIMYSRAAGIISKENARYLLSLKKKQCPHIKGLSLQIGLFHGSPDDPDEFLFETTPESRFTELSQEMQKEKIDIVVTGHSHTPYYKKVGGVHFINPGSVGRMFDEDPRSSCAVLEIDNTNVTVKFYRIDYPVEEVIKKLRQANFPEIYCKMYATGKKLN